MARSYPLLINGDPNQRVGEVVIQNELEESPATDMCQIMPILDTTRVGIQTVAFSISAIPAVPE